MKMQYRVPHRSLPLALALLVLLGGCFGQAQEMVGTRPASRLPAVVESYGSTRQSVLARGAMLS